MKILIVHRSFPGQFKNLIHTLRNRGDQIFALGEDSKIDQKKRRLVDQFIGYRINRSNTPKIPDGLLDFESKTIRAISAAEAMEPLADKNYQPDLILTHSGWGESMFLHHLFPGVPQLHFLEYFYGASDGDMAFCDPILEQNKVDNYHWRKKSLAQIKSLGLLTSLEEMRWGLSPTEFQRSQFPSRIQKRTSVIHDGIDINFSKPNIHVEFKLPNGKLIKNGDPVITFVNRTFEPYRGIHVFLKALVKVQKEHSNVQTLLVGDDTPNVSYGAHRLDGKGWVSALRTELANQLDWNRIHLLGRISHSNLQSVFQISTAHVYLTYPFVLSWSMLEAMSSGCLIIGSKTKPVQEVIVDGNNGLLVEFSDIEGLSNKLIKAINMPKLFSSIKESARLTVMNNYELNSCINARLNLIDKIAR